ncbi:GtrA family protein [Candidatus Nitrosacidococcus sp. I8]|uniref:GtrA family protein n=1 Tax=Candidatus Nitrosacidococcus sp. I8 TaxID=2942908 RepID=UPI0022275109|nr:GtrA family protein [Candidatus Nitrosacidococcus sp. I8]CAH9018253.1 hypothetical protein NURINAE_00819 [Candidatus Nitrosacidococcus sp. I8]
MFIILYTLFAFIATGINLLFQWPIFHFFEGKWVLYGALMVGTLAGLVTKYILDKKWIFRYETKNKKDNLQKFGLYSLMGVFTTFIFWGTEMLFFYFFSFEGAQYIGGAIGLTVGYMVKYLLDRRFVFV